MISLFAAFVLGSIGSPQAVNLSRIPKEGDESQYHLIVQNEVERGEYATDTSDITEEVTDVTAASIRAKFVFQNVKHKEDGRESALPNGATTVTVDRQNHFLKVEDESIKGVTVPVREILVALPDHPVSVGDKWDADYPLDVDHGLPDVKVTYTVDATEDAGTVHCLRVKFEGLIYENPDAPFKLTGSVLLRPDGQVQTYDSETVFTNDFHSKVTLTMTG